MQEKNRDWKKVVGLDEVQVFQDGDLIESFNEEDLSVELFDHNPEHTNE